MKNIITIEPVRTLWEQRDLIGLLARTDLRKRYQGSLLGVLWSFAQPLAMLAVYSFVFGVIFKSRWQTPAAQSGPGFALILFSGIVIFNLFAESVQRAPVLLVSHPYYVKKVIFPTEILPVSLMGSVLMHFSVSFAVLLVWAGVFFGQLGWGILWVPVILLPLLMFCMGVTWFLAAVGVFVRDTTFIAALVVPVVFFMTPIVYPFSAVPPALAVWLKWNILGYFVETVRQTLFFEASFDIKHWLVAMAASAAVFLAGYVFFMRLKTSFADAL